MLLNDIKSFLSFAKPSNIKEWFSVENVFVNYFWLYFVSGVIFTLIKKNWLFTLGWPLVLYLMWLKNRRKVKLNFFDFLWILGFVWIIVTWVFNDYPNKFNIIVRCFINEIAFMFAYWIGRNSRTNYLYKIYKNSYKPLLLACLIGLYCYFMQPSWYMAKTEEYLFDAFGNDAANKLNSLEFFRLRSVFASTYSMAYYCAIILIGEFFFIFNTIKRKGGNYNYHLTFLVILVTCSIFCMMRGPIVGAFIGAIYAIIYSIIFTRGRQGLRILLWIGGILIIGFVVILNYVDLEILDFMISKFDEVTDEDSNFIVERLFLQGGDGKAMLIGDGYARYSNNATLLGMRSIPDSEYAKIFEEQGIIGLFITVLMFGFGLFKCLYNYKYLFFEFTLLTMLMICMIGADPLTISDKHCFIYWLALGQVSGFTNNRNNIACF